MDRVVLERVWSASGQANAEMIKMYLESFGIQVFIIGESVGAAYGLTSAPLGTVDLMVPKAQADDARRYLREINQQDPPYSDGD